ncbi:PHP domain-containing protein [Christensenellaceae bacterium OttesenSCG-928-M15]|nr:PHP domain-containing protein [Christensenellaceae bacterium OttesenSCG-928-M15]
MIKLAADLHIHSCLSPCGDMEMTPNNLVNMAYLKGLDAIAVCDHNSTRNLPACKMIADARELVFIAGMEVETKEEVHVLTLFADVKTAMEFGGFVYAHLPDTPNIPGFFGEQIAMNDDDEPVYEEKKMLLQSTTLSIDDVVTACRQAGGLPIPAHINRTSNSLLNNLGFVPDNLRFPTLEVYKRLEIKGVDLEKYHVVYNSDAHNLTDMSERENFISAYDRSPEGLLRYLAEYK